MIGQYLLNTNKNATVSILQKKFGAKQGLSSEKILDFGTVVFSFLFYKYYPIID